jgi:RNA polymerase sigma-70 factor (ECF subfamily)
VFPTTRWTLVLSARDGAEAEKRAFEHLCSAYWRPVYVYLRRKGLRAEEAEDAVQGFFLQLMQKPFLHRLDPARGRLRSYLLRALEHYLVNLHEARSALKRGGGLRIVPLDAAGAERDLAAAAPDAESAFEREWALAVMQRALERLRSEYTSGKRGAHIATLLRFFGLDEAPSYAEAAAASSMSVPQFKAALHRARQRFRELLREEIAASVDADGDVEPELAALLRALSA